MYKAHCQRILDSVVRANFHEVRTRVHPPVYTYRIYQDFYEDDLYKYIHV